MDLVLTSQTIDPTPEPPLNVLIRRLNAAKKRARYWSGTVKFHRESFAVRRRRSTNRGNDYQVAMEEIIHFGKQISQITGKQMKPYNPRQKVIDPRNEVKTLTL